MKEKFIVTIKAIVETEVEEQDETQELMDKLENLSVENSECVRVVDWEIKDIT